MIPQTVDIKTADKSDHDIILELVNAYNLLAQQVQLALQNVDMSDVIADSGVSLEALLQSGALKGEQGVQGNDGKVWRPHISLDGMISWTLTDAGGITPLPTQVRGEGVASGGTTGQVLVKKSDADYDTEWVTL